MERLIKIQKPLGQIPFRIKFCGRMINAKTSQGNIRFGQSSHDSFFLRFTSNYLQAK
jgi:hypothetical protein